MDRTKLLLALLFVAAAFGLVFAGVRKSTVADLSASKLITAETAKRAPDFTLSDAATGQPFRLSDAAKAKPLVLDFWATWCGPCREELPHLEALSQKYAGRVAFYGVNSSDARASISQFSKQNGLTFPMLSDSHHNVAFSYGADAIPLLVVLDTRGRVRYVADGYAPGDENTLDKNLAVLLAERRG